MKTRSTSILSIALGILVFQLAALPAQTPAQKKKPTVEEPIARQGLLDALRIRGLTVKALVQEIQKRGVDFEMTPQVEAELRTAGAKPPVIDAARANYRPLLGTLNVRATVSGTTINITGVGSYTDTVTGLKLRPGHYDIAGSKPGYRPNNKRVEIKFGETANLELRLEPMTTTELLKSAQDSYDLSNYPMAIALTRAALSREPDQPKAVTLLASSLYLQGDYDESITYFIKAISSGGSAIMPVLHKHSGSGAGRAFCSGRITFTRESLEFYSADFPDEGFRIPYSKISETSVKDQIRLFLKVRIKLPKNRKETDEEYNLYSTDAVATGRSVTCPQCLPRMRVILQVMRQMRPGS